jgi:hypothetical protein
MSEVVKLQLIGLTVVGMGIVILLFVRAQFARVIGFVAIVLGLFSLVALAVPQMASLPPAEEKFRKSSSARGNVRCAIPSARASRPGAPI